MELSRIRSLSLARVHGAVVLAGLVVSAAVLVEPRIGAGLTDPALRLVIEVSGLFLALTAALVLALTERADLGPSRDAFIAALLVLAFTNAAFTVVPAVFEVRSAVDRGLAFYPWVASRFVAGGLMLAAGSGRPRQGVVRTLLLAFGALLLVDTVLLAAGERLPVLVALDEATGAVEVLSWAVLVPIMLVPAALFGSGAWLAARLHRRGTAPLYAWLSVAMTLQVFAQLHGLLAPGFLGPVITTMDLFRTSSWVLLAGGAVAQLRHLYVARSRTAERQAEDLIGQQRLLARQQRLAEREHDFQAVVSHEMATPIAALRAFVHVLYSPKADESQRARAREGLRAEASRLAELVDRIDELRDLDVTTPSIDLRPVAVRPLLEEVRAFASGLPGRSDVRVQAEDDRVLADPVRLGQLLRNLVSNAARYSPAGAPIELVGEISGDDHYRIQVVDRGPGIPVAERARLLDPYTRGSSTGDEPGTGLGLYIARRLAAAHDGTLELHDGTDGVGTTVKLTLRRAR